MIRTLRQIVLPLGLIAGILTPTAALAGDDHKPRHHRSHDSHWEGKKLWRGDRHHKFRNWHPDICTAEVRRCVKKKVWYDRYGYRHVRPARCWVEDVRYRC